MRFFENTRKPQGFGGKLMTKMMNSGHAKLSQWGFSNISAKSDAEVGRWLWRRSKYCGLA